MNDIDYRNDINQIVMWTHLCVEDSKPYVLVEITWKTDTFLYVMRLGGRGGRRGGQT